jgi:uncharacterized protein (DUF983 family)
MPEIDQQYRRGIGFPLLPLKRGLRKTCPCCGHGALYHRFLKPVTHCAACNTPLAEIRTDDIAPYFTILIVGHIVVPALLLTEQLLHPPVWVHWSIWPALTAGLMLAFLPRIKGAVLAVMWHVGIKGDEQR